MTEQARDGGTCGVGAILAAMKTLREEVGVIKAKKKEGVKFKVRSAEDLADKLRRAEAKAGVISYPIDSQGSGYPVDNGTLASINLTIRIKALSDGSYLDIAGFGLGADSQDKAGGKAMTYAWKAAFIQALQAGGADDTDDSDTPIPGGVKKRGTTKVTTAEVEADLLALKEGDAAGFATVLQKARALSFEQQTALADTFKAARQRIGLVKAAPAATPTPN